MSKIDASKIPPSVVESLARATLAAMRREKEQERPSSYDKITDNEEWSRPAKRAKGAGK